MSPARGRPDIGTALTTPDPRATGVRLAYGRVAEVTAVCPGRPWGVLSRGPRAPRGWRMVGIGHLSTPFLGSRLLGVLTFLVVEYVC